MLVRKLRYGNSKALYAIPGMFSRSNLNPNSTPRCQITKFSCCKITFQRSINPWQSFSTMASTILVQARDPAKLSEELQTALDEHRLNDAWNFHEQHMNMEGFPRKSIVNNLLTTSAQSLQLQWLENSYHLVQKAIEEHKQNLLEKTSLIYLSLCLAKYSLPIKSATILRKLLETEQFPPVTAWSAILAYMSQTGPGAYLAAELVLEIGFMFQDGRVDPRKKSNEELIAMKPNTTAVNIALAGCLLFGTNRKAEQILDMVPRIGVKADVTMLMMMGHVYERNGRKEELKKLERYINEAHDLSDVQFREFYNCLLSCNLKFGDLESASNMVLEMLKKAKKAQDSLGLANFQFEVTKVDDNLSIKSCQIESLTYEKSNDAERTLTYEDFCGDRKFIKLEAESKELLNTLIMKFQNEKQLITTERGILQPTETIFVKLVKGFLEAGKIKELVKFLVKVEKEDSNISPHSSPLIQVVNSCISLGWLDHAHDLLDEMRVCGVKTESSVYSSLLKAYCKENKTKEVKSLIRDARMAGVQLDASCYNALIESHVIDEDTQGALKLFKEMKEAKLDKTNQHSQHGQHGQREFDMLVQGCARSGEAKLMAKLLQEIKDGQKVDCGVHDWNNVIHFFCRKKLMQDAEKALKKMRSLGHEPNAQTFHSLVTGYAAIGGKYTEVTELWGEMKVLGLYHGMKFDQELLDSVLYTFVRGGFFIRANEVVEMMEKGKMFVDKYKYRTLFLKYHKTFCKGKTPKFQTESQIIRREAALSFKKWVGLF